MRKMILAGDGVRCGRGLSDSSLRESTCFRRLIVRTGPCFAALVLVWSVVATAQTAPFDVTGSWVGSHVLTMDDGQRVERPVIATIHQDGNGRLSGRWSAPKGQLSGQVRGRLSPDGTFKGTFTIQDGALDERGRPSVTCKGRGDFVGRVGDTTGASIVWTAPRWRLDIAAGDDCPRNARDLVFGLVKPK
jgi:hypothetical protein